MTNNCANWFFFEQICIKKVAAATYLDLILKFSAKSIQTSPKTQLQWEHILKPLFQLHDNSSLDALGENKISNLLRPFNDYLNKLKAYDDESITLRANFSVVLGNQHDVNKVYAQLKNDVQNDCTVNGTMSSLVSSYTQWAKQAKMSRTHLNQVIKSVPLMTRDHDFVKDLWLEQFKNVVRAREDFVTNIATLSKSISHSKPKHVNISAAVNECWTSQNQVKQCLKTAQAIIIQFKKMRNVFASFLIELQSKLDGQIVIFKKPKSVLERGMTSIRRTFSSKR